MVSLRLHRLDGPHTYIQMNETLSELKVEATTPVSFIGKAVSGYGSDTIIRNTISRSSQAIEELSS